MVERCNRVGIRIYVDAVINHMAMAHGVGTAGSRFNGALRSFPEVPYGPNDFNDEKCSTFSGKIEAYDDPNQVK